MRRQDIPIRVAEQFESIEGRPTLLQSIHNSCWKVSDKHKLLQLENTKLIFDCKDCDLLYNDFSSIKLPAPAASYQAAVVRIVQSSDGTCEPRLELQHTDPSLSIVLPYINYGDANYHDDCVAIWRSLGQKLGLSLIFIDIDGNRFEVEKRVGNVVVKMPFKRIRGHGTHRRRPNFLRRRKFGHTSMKPV